MITTLKAVARGAAALLTFPAFVLYRTGKALFGADRAFPGWSQAFALLPGLSGVYLRRAFYVWALPRCGADCCISFGSVFSHPTVEVGRGVYVGLYCCLGEVSLEDDVLLGSHVSIANGGAQHGVGRLDAPIREQPGSRPRVTVGQNSWVGERAVVLADVGRHCVIGAGAVVTKPIPDFAVAVGVPAKVVRYRCAADPSAEPNRPGAVSEPSALSDPVRATINQGVPTAGPPGGFGT